MTAATYSAATVATLGTPAAWGRLLAAALVLGSALLIAAGL